MAVGSATAMAMGFLVVGPQSATADGTTSPTLTTTATPMAGPLGTTLQDSADLEGASNLDGSGSITFDLYGPGDTSCTGTVLDSETVGSISGDGAQGTTTGYAADAAGTYDWVASFSGDSNNAGVSTQCGDEPVVIAEASPTLTTTATPMAGPLGTTLQDSADLEGASNLDGSGSITFDLYGPGDTSCTGAVLDSETVGSISGDGAQGTTTGYAADAAGTYDWVASFSGDSNNAGVSTQCGDEPVVVARASSSVTTAVIDASTGSGWTGSETTGASAYDMSVVTGVAGIPPTGTVGYTLWTNGTCNGNGSPAGTGLTLGSPSVPTGALAVGSYSFDATYSGDANYDGEISDCEVFPVGMATPTMVTTPTPATGTVGVAIASAKDTATVSGGGVTPTGTVSFTLYKSDCATKVLGPSPAETLTAGSASYAAAWTPAAAGTYYWVASYSGDSNYGAVTDDALCNVGGESVTIGMATPTMVTTPTPATGTVGVAIASAKDTATVSGGGVTPTGTVSFTLYKSDCATKVLGPSPAETLTAGSASYAAAWTPAAAGTYYWVASYSGDSNYGAVTDDALCNVGGESVTIGMATPTMVTTPTPATGTVGVAIASAKDTATVSGGGVTPTGTVSFTLYKSDCATKVLGPSPAETLTAGSASYAAAWTPAAAGTYYWVASYSGDSNYGAVTDDALCNVGGESVTIGMATPTMVTTPTPATGTVGVAIASAKDTATVSGGGVTPTGTVSFTLYKSDCATKVLGPSPAETLTAGSASYAAAWTPAAAGTYYWVASYSGDSNYGAVTDDALCNVGGESVTIGMATPTMVTTPTPATGTVGVAIASAKDTATVSGGGVTPTGTVSFTLYKSDCATKVLGPSPAETLTAGSTSYAAAWTPAAAGTYYWVASYSGDSNYGAVTDDALCNVGGESVTVGVGDPDDGDHADAGDGDGGGGDRQCQGHSDGEWWRGDPDGDGELHAVQVGLRDQGAGAEPGGDVDGRVDELCGGLDAGGGGHLLLGGELLG